MSTPMQPPNMPPQLAAAPGKVGFAVTALILGLLSPFAFFAEPGAGLIFGIGATAFGILSLRQYSQGVGSGRGMAI